MARPETGGVPPEATGAETPMDEVTPRKEKIRRGVEKQEGNLDLLASYREEIPELKAQIAEPGELGREEIDALEQRLADVTAAADAVELLASTEIEAKLEADETNKEQVLADLADKTNEALIMSGGGKNRVESNAYKKIESADLSKEELEIHDAAKYQTKGIKKNIEDAMGHFGKKAIEKIMTGTDKPMDKLKSIRDVPSQLEEGTWKALKDEKLSGEESLVNLEARLTVMLQQANLDTSNQEVEIMETLEAISRINERTLKDTIFDYSEQIEGAGHVTEYGSTVSTRERLIKQFEAQDIVFNKDGKVVDMAA